MNPAVIIGRVEARAISRRRWTLAVIVVGLGLIIAGAILAATRPGNAAIDTMRSWTAAVELIAGLAIAASLGASTVNRDADGGWVGMQVATGTPRAVVALGRIAGRLLVLVAAFALWIVVAAVASAAIGQGGDWPLVVNGLAMLGNMVLVLVAAALCSVALGPIASGIVGVALYVAAQAIANLAAATDASVIGTSWSPLIRVLYAIFPRGMTSPMLSEMQADGVAGVAAPQLEVNLNIVVVPPTSWLTVLWNALWWAALALATAGAFRRRALS